MRIRKANTRKRWHWRMIGGEYVWYSRRYGIRWHPKKTWENKPWPEDPTVLQRYKFHKS